MSVRIGAATQDGTPTEWAASGRSITFPGYLRAYVEGSDDPSAELEDRESVPPVLAAGDELPEPSLEAKGTHQPTGPLHRGVAREAARGARHRTAVHLRLDHADHPGPWLRLEEGTALVPTWTALAVVNLLEQHFGDLVDYSYTARMEDDLDEIAARHVEREPWLHKLLVRPGGQRRGRPQDGRPWARRDRRGRHQHHPARRRRGRERHRRQTGSVRALREAGDDTASVPDDVAPDDDGGQGHRAPVGAAGRP